jgi:hypothetical protein
MRDILSRSARWSGLLALGLFLLTSRTPARAAAPIAVNACQTLSAPGNYIVTKNLTASGDCLVLTVSNIAIDLQGHKIVGNGSSGGITDGGNSIAYIIVANGKISNFSEGIDLSTDTEQTANLILNVNSSGNAADGIFMKGRDNNLVNVTASNNGGAGVELLNCCDSLFKVTTNGNNAEGVLFNAEDYLLNVTSNGNSADGVSGSDDSLIVNSVANKNSGNGFDLQSFDNLVVSSVANGNSENGILLGTFSQVTDSKAGKNHGDGINFTADFGLVTSVAASNNSGDGVFLKCPGNAVRVSAKGNGGTNLNEDLSDGDCTNVRNNAP